MKELRAAYVKELTSAVASGEYVWPDSLKTPEIVADQMIKAIALSRGREDWFRGNPALRRAAKSVGIKTAPELRAFVRGTGEGGI